MKKPKLTYTDRELELILSNALLATSRSERGEIKGTRLQKIKAYAIGVLQALMDHVEDRTLTIDEMVCAAQMVAFLLHAGHVMKRAEDGILDPGMVIEIRPQGERTNGK